ncbi:hypothetical protein L484_021920 [Morus notabilis]|uniref:Uncharacterized protein n=1 Tax=Morus notabilis TaxID=981085 RepID=W9SSY8_9ROSA|nr:hypothetical protein L484_021920 [Morus notabilis]
MVYKGCHRLSKKKKKKTTMTSQGQEESGSGSGSSSRGGGGFNELMAYLSEGLVVDSSEDAWRRLVGELLDRRTHAEIGWKTPDARVRRTCPGRRAVHAKRVCEPVQLGPIDLRRGRERHVAAW